MLRVKFRRGNRRTWSAVLVCLLSAIFIGFAWWILQTGVTPVRKSGQTKQAIVQAPQPVGISSNVLFLGNTFWGRYINDWSMASPLKYSYPFSRLNEFNRDQYDAWISGLECPTVAGVNMTSAEMEQALQFNCSPDYLPEAAKWFTAFSLANNHTDNQGAEGFTETQQQFNKNGIQYFGSYDPTIIDEVCEVISLPVKISKNDDTTTKGKLPVAMCGYHGVFSIPPAESVAEIQKYSQYMPVIAMPHMGTEYRSDPDQLKTDFYRSLIDAGADTVIGDHPHWIQTTESYKGHLIVYSMGNFIFDQQDTPEVVRSASIQMVMNSTDKDHDLLSRWLLLGESCSGFKDDCLAQAVQQKLPKLTINYQFAAIGTSDSDKIVKPANDAQQASILQRLKWQSTMNQLQTPYSSL